MVEIEVRKSETPTEKAATTNIDIGEIINKVRDFVSGLKEMSPDGKPMTVKIDSFSFTFSKANGQYDLSLTSKILIKPKED